MITCLTLDADWSHEKVAEYTLGIIRDHGIPLTYFATHDQRISPEPMCEVAWHPDIERNKANEEFAKLFKRFPNTRGLRPHRMYTNGGDFERLLKHYGIEWTSASFSWDRFFPLHTYGGLPDFSVNWGDNIWFWDQIPPDFNEIKSDTAGIFTLNFHPIHVYLNTATKAQYDRAKPFYHDIDSLSKFRNSNRRGIKDILLEVLSLSSEKSVSFMKLSDALVMWTELETRIRK